MSGYAVGTVARSFPGFAGSRWAYSGAMFSMKL